jgi:hypothetical protein
MAIEPRRVRSAVALLAVMSALGVSCVGKISETVDADAAGTPSGSGGTVASGATGSGARGSGAAAGSGGTAAGGSSGNGDPSSGGSSSASSGDGAGGSGSSSGGSSGGTSSVPPTFACDDSVAPPAESLRRLTMTEYQNSVADLITWALGGDGANAKKVADAVAPALADLPTDVRQAVPEDLHGAYRRMDQTLQQEHVDGAYAVGVALGQALTQSSVFGQVVGSCATDASSSNDATCLAAFIKRFGARVLRRPLSDDDVSFYESVYGSNTAADPAAYADVIGVLLNAPEALYFVEHGEQAVSGQSGVYTLSAYELASRLSYQLWQTAPDDELVAAADDGSLLDEATYQKEVARLVADARARATLDDFFADWMKVADLPALDAKNADPVFKAFAGGDLPKPSLRQAMIDDVLGLLDYQTWTASSTVGDLFTTELSFAKDAGLAKIYGVSSWDGKSTPPALPEGQRPGLLTRALFLASGSPNTRPILKGVFIRKAILCDELGDPPPGANAMPPKLEPGMTTRESVEAITEMPGTICASCHQAFINPLGYATEDFDALGRFRSEQVLFDDAGNVTGTKAIDTATAPHVEGDDETQITGPGDLMQLIRASGKVEACLARNFFRFTYARWDDPTTDGCALEPVRSAVSGDGKLQDLLAATVLTPSFRRRAFQ